MIDTVLHTMTLSSFSQPVPPPDISLSYLSRSMPTDLRMFTCTTAGCGKSFRRRDYLRRHEAAHSNYRPFSCGLCQILFTRKDILEKHYKTQSHQQKRFNLTSRNPSLTFKYVDPKPQEPSKTKSPQVSESTPSFYANLDWLFGELDQTEPDVYTTSEADPTLDDVPSSKTLESAPLTKQTEVAIKEILEQLQVDEFPFGEVSIFLQQFARHFNSIYPIIHQPTFDANDINRWLLVAIISIGMSYTTSEHYDIACKIHKRFRLNLYGQISDVKVDLELLQAVLLDDLCGKMLGDTNQISLGHVFHGTSINLLRYSGYLDNLQEPSIESEDTDTMTTWKEWIHYESCKRTAFLGFLVDSQHAALYGHTQLLSSFEINLDLPYTDAVWNAPDYELFRSEYRKQPTEMKIRKKPEWEAEDMDHEFSKSSLFNTDLEGHWPSFLFSLRRLMQPYKKHHKEYHEQCFSQFSRLIMLHGVMSITWDLKGRNLLDLGFVRKRSLSLLLKRLNIALVNWKGYYEIQIKFTNIRSGSSQGVLNDYGLSDTFWNNVSSLQLAIITLNYDFNSVSNVIDSILKREPSSLSNEQALQAWARTDSSKRAVVASCKLLNSILENLNTIRTIPHMIWAVYISCVTIWSYELNVDVISSPNSKSLLTPSHNNHNGLGSSLDILKKDVKTYIMSILEDESFELKRLEPKDISVYLNTQKYVRAILEVGCNLIKLSMWRSADNLVLKLRAILESQGFLPGHSRSL